MNKHQTRHVPRLPKKPKPFTMPTVQPVQPVQPVLSNEQMIANMEASQHHRETVLRRLYKVTATQTRWKYCAYVDAGFSPDQATQLVCAENKKEA